MAAVFLALGAAVLPPGAQAPSRGVEEALAPAPAPDWNLRRSQDLLSFLERARSHGLDPQAYGVNDLRRAIERGDAAEMRRLSIKAYERIASDLARGRLAADPIAARFGDSGNFDANALMASALLRDDVAGSLEALAPHDLGYLKLRNALGALPATAPPEQRAALVATLERRRWMPREPQGRHIVVNIPAYRLDLFDGDRLVESRRVIVGKPATPTPQFGATVESVTINPSWFVPDSIVKESVGALVRRNPAEARARGYTWTRDRAGKLRVVQSPGEWNALGRLKLELPNAFRVYIHDTPTRELFEASDRALSHGCIRAAELDTLAAALLDGQGWDIARIREAIAAGKTKSVALDRPIRVDIVYFTAEPAGDASIRYWPDVYRLDRNMADRLAGRAAKAKGALAIRTECTVGTAG